jgi:flagellar motor component MotA
LILLGYGIGAALCPVCGVVGAVIGLIIGISIKP